MTPRFNKDFQIEYGVACEIMPGISRVVANNPKDYTFKGTNCYLIGTSELVLLDPGPLLHDHIDAVMKAVAGRPVKAILVTHSHEDHSPAAKPLSKLTGAPVCGYTPIDPAIAALSDEDVDLAFSPDRALKDGDTIEVDGRSVRALHTPGHFPNHLCYTLEDEGILFSGDHVMGWSTTVISPPLGNLEHYLASLGGLLERSDHIYLPSHGPIIEEPQAYVRQLIAHREARENQIIDCLMADILQPEDIVDHIYTGLTPRLAKAAAQSVRAHLDFLRARGLLDAENRYTSETTTQNTGLAPANGD